MTNKLSTSEGRSFDGHELDFPIEKTRLEGVYILVIVSGLGTLGYGLALMTEAVSILQLINSFKTYIPDINFSIYPS